MVDLATLVRRHLDDQHSTLWGKAYDLSQPDSRQQAQRWLAEQIKAVVGERII